MLDTKKFSYPVRLARLSEFPGLSPAKRDDIISKLKIKPTSERSGYESVTQQEALSIVFAHLKREDPKGVNFGSKRARKDLRSVIDRNIALYEEKKADKKK